MKRLMFLGDIVGRSARQAVIQQVPALKTKLACEFLVANCENAAGGFGVTPEICDELFAAGIDVLTTGNHVWDKSEISPYIEKERRLLRPVNMAAEFPGMGATVVTSAGGTRCGVINVMGNLFMSQNDKAFAAIDKVLSSMKLGVDADIIMVDFHGEATSEKIAMGHYLDGRVSLVVGTHTHIPTADTRILTAGTAYQTDAGMCGDYDSVIGMDKAVAVSRFTDTGSGRLAVAKGTPSLCGLIVDIDERGLAHAVRPFRSGGVLPETAS